MRAYGKLWFTVVCFALGILCITAVGASARGDLPDADAMSSVGPAAWNDSDLVISQISGPATGKAGNFIKVSVKVKNQGLNVAEDFRVGIYLSQNKTIDSHADRLIGGIEYGVVLPGLAMKAVLILMVPESTPAGKYFLGAVADYTKAVDEDDESNNSKACATSIEISPKP
jgi:subtilase family serine protease